ncbi:MAG: TonB-dependent receptor plug domain-containing protein, partial [Bacteroidota bacterium]
MLAIMFFAGISLFGQTSDTIKLKEVIISGDNQTIEKALIPSHLISGTNPNITDALNQLPGFFKVQSNNYSITYRGQYGNRLRVEQNGNRRSGVTPEGGYFAEDINPSDIDEIKIVNGAEKVIYGSGSSGGIIQLNDVDKFEEMKSPIHHIYTAYSSNNQNRILGMMTGFQKERLKLRISGRFQDTGDYKTGDGTTVNNSSYQQNNLSLKLLIKGKNDKNLWDISQQLNNGNWNRPQGFQNNPLELRNFKNNYNSQSTVKHTSSIRPNIKLTNRASLLLLQTDQSIRSFNSDMTDINVERIRTYTKNTLDYEVAVDFQLDNSTSVKSGIDLYYSNLEELNSEDNFINNTFIENELIAERLDYQGGIFGMIDHQFSNLSVTGSLRWDIASIGNQDQMRTFSAITGGVDLSLKLSDYINSTWSLGRFFRYPTQLEAVGVFFGGRGTFLGNPDINPEYSHQLDWSISGVKNKFSYQVTTWFHHFDGRITAIPTGENEFTYENVESARIFGSEWVLTYETKSINDSHQFTLNLTGTTMKGDVL